MDLGIAIVSFNTCQLTLDCLRSVYEGLSQSRLQAQVCVVDNASSDGSVARILQEFPQALVIASAENVGFAAASNLAMRRLMDAGAAPKYILLLNPDTLVMGDALQALVSFMDGHPRVGVAGPRLVYGDGSFQHSAFHFPTLWMALFDFWPLNHRLTNSRLNGRYPHYLYERGIPFPVDHPLGAALLIRRETLAEVGPLDPGYFMYCEEIDWCLRIKHAGWQIYCVPQAVIVHLGGQSTRQFREPMFIALWRSRYRLFGRHYSRVYQALARRIVRAGLRHDMGRLHAAHRKGSLGSDELARRIAAYRSVMEL